MMHALAAIGFHQSYTYFTWRNRAGELDRVPARAGRPGGRLHAAELLRQHARHPHRVPAARRACPRSGSAPCWPRCCRPTWGVYSGFELGENVPLVPGSEEYLDSEKYPYRPRDWDARRQLAPPTRHRARSSPGSTCIRRAHPALHQLRNLRFHYADQPEILCFSKSTGSSGWGGERDTVIVVVNLDPHQPREATVWLDGRRSA